MQIIRITLLIWLALASNSAAVFAQKGKKAVKPTDPAQPAQEPQRELIDQVTITKTLSAKEWRYAGGMASMWSIRQDYGARTFKRFEPELVGFYYSQLTGSRLWLRHGARLGYSSDQPQMPQSARLEETDYKIAVEEALLVNGVVIPSLSFGAGYDWREVKPVKADPVLSADKRLNNKDQFAWYYAQIGLGVPALSGEYLLEPALRWQHLPIDRRTRWAFGFELTKAW